MNRRAFVRLGAIGLVTSANGTHAEAATEVKHGERPKFVAKTTGSPFWCNVVGHYTTTADCAAAGVTKHRFKSKDHRQIRAELLALRSGFLEWFREEYEKNEGGGPQARRGAIAAVRGLADQWERFIDVHPLPLGSCAR